MNYEDIRNALTEFPGLSKDKLNTWILEALQDICEETWVYYEILTFLTTAGTAEHTLSPSDSNTKVIGLVRYGAERCVVDTPSPVASDGTATGTLTAGTTYTYKVTSLTGNYGVGLPCTAVAYVCPASGTITLTWTAIDNADGYNIYRLSSGIYYFLATTTGVTYSDDGSVTLSTTVTLPAKATAVKQISVSNLESEKQSDSNWRYNEGNTIQRVIWDGNVTVRLNIIPDTTNMGFQLAVALEPSDEQTTIPAILALQKRLILDFVRSKVYAHPKTNEIPYQDYKLSEFHMGLYLAKRSKLKAKILRGYGGTMKITGGYFA